jgi:flavin reductase (DIM6/NTAB) family NADH-FMN oxidoreductase RutF
VSLLVGSETCRAERAAQAGRTERATARSSPRAFTEKKGETMKEVPVGEAWKRKYPEQVSLAVSVDSEGKANIIALGWCMPASFDPPMMAISVGKTRYSHQLISECREFVVAFPSEEMGKEVLYCGTHSGRDVDKFRETGLVAVPAKKVRPPLIEGCVANFECKVIGEIETGDHTVFVGEVVAAHVSEQKKRRLYNLGDFTFSGL